MKNNDWFDQKIQKIFLEKKGEKPDHFNKKNKEKNTHEERKQAFLKAFSMKVSHSLFWKQNYIDSYFQLKMAACQKGGLNDE
ncbi:hypothetical protein [Priestia megaterium]|uniref:hypothetical protein n=1 Tax=Priestia megaterium TaxID=1404 RepID=UPI000BF885BC|nr:hypothetical protein [Priestia megaterium]PFR88894.1 hypothetical protein COK39_25625 [Priestia megaterium]